MKLTDLNREGGIGANSLYCELGSFKFLVDAGLHPKKVGFGALPDFSRIKDVRLDFVVLSHCHLDHLGALPVVMRDRPDTEVLMSMPSQVLAERMLHNSCNVMKRQREEHSIPEYPLSTLLTRGNRSSGQPVSRSQVRPAGDAQERRRNA